MAAQRLSRAVALLAVFAFCATVPLSGVAGQLSPAESLYWDHLEPGAKNEAKEHFTSTAVRHHQVPSRPFPPSCSRMKPDDLLPFPFRPFIQDEA